MPTNVIDLVDSTNTCPIHGGNVTMKKIVFFQESEPLDDQGNPIKDLCVCPTCGFRAEFYSQFMLQEIQNQVNEAVPSKDAVLQLKNLSKDDRKLKPGDRHVPK